MSIPDVKDNEALRAWLENRPWPLSLALGVRAGLRVVPLLAFPANEGSDEFQPATRFILPLLRALALNWAASRYPARWGALRSSAGRAMDAADHAATSYAGFYGNSNNIPVDISAASDAAYLAAACVREFAAGNRSDGSRYTTASDAAFHPATHTVGAGDSAISAVKMDLEEFEKNKNVQSVIVLPLWSSKIPAPIADRWGRLRPWLEGLSSDWDVWTRWYDAVLAARPTPSGEELDIFRVRLNDEGDWKRGEQDPSYVNRLIKAKETEIAGRETQAPPQPAQAPGPIVEFKNGKLALEDGFPSKSGFDATSQGLLHERVKSRLPQLNELSNRTSNTFPGLKLAVDEYAAVASLPIDQLDTEVFWMSGLALLTQAQAFERQDPSSGHGRLDAPHQAILSEVAGLHAGLVLGFPKGRMLTERAREAQLPAAEFLEPPTVTLLDAFKNNRRLLEERLRRFMETSREVIRIAGWDATRAGYGAYALVRNTLIRMGTAIVSIDKFAAKSFVGSMVIASAGVYVFQAFGISAETLTAMIEFFRANYGSILQYAAPFPELRAWITYVMEFLDHDRGR